MNLRRRLSRRVLIANLQRETEARLKAEETVEGQAKYIEQLPHPSDVWQAQEAEDHWRERYNAAQEEVAHLRGAVRIALDLRGSTDGYLLVGNLQARETLERGLHGKAGGSA